MISLPSISGDASFWSLCVASGYLKVISYKKSIYKLKLTNKKITEYMEARVKAWFKDDTKNYNSFGNAMIEDNLDGMEISLSQIRNCL